MTARSLAALLVVATAAALGSCAGGGTTAPGIAPVGPATPTSNPSPAATATPVVNASPQSIQFDAIPPIPSPRPVVLSGSAVPSGAPIDVSIAPGVVTPEVPAVPLLAGAGLLAVGATVFARRRRRRATL